MRGWVSIPFRMLDDYRDRVRNRCQKTVAGVVYIGCKVLMMLSTWCAIFGMCEGIPSNGISSTNCNGAIQYPHTHSMSREYRRYSRNISMHHMNNLICWTRIYQSSSAGVRSPYSQIDKSFLYVWLIHQFLCSFWPCVPIREYTRVRIFPVIILIA